MPKTAVDYSRTVIYKIVCNDLAIKELYVGSTTDFIKRKHHHKSACKSLDLKLYRFIRDNGGWDNWTMIEIEKFPCSDNNEARCRERHWYEKLKANLNVICPTLSIENQLNTRRKYWHLHKEDNNAKQSVYYMKNKNVIDEKSKQYNELNKEQISTWKSGIQVCHCGTTYTNSNKARHLQSKAHHSSTLVNLLEIKT